MVIYVAKNAGFCFGVKRAIMLVEEALKEGEKIYSLGPIIHNPQVVQKLKDEGVETVDSIEMIPDNSTVVIRSHGVEKSTIERAKEKHLTLIDATCPFVKKPQKYLEMHRDGGFLEIIVGKPNHPEVIGIKSYGNNPIILDPEDGFDNIQEKILKQAETFYDNINNVSKIKKAIIVAQTTLRIEDFQKVVNEILPIVEELRVFNTICNATRNNQAEARELAKKVDLMIVVGGKNSSNTNKLYNISKSLAPNAVLVETADELDVELLNEIEKIGVTAGASTPDWIIRDVINKIKKTQEEKQYE